MYNCVCSTVLGSSVGVFIGVSSGVVTGWEESTPVCMAPVGGTCGFSG